MGPRTSSKYADSRLQSPFHEAGLEVRPYEGAPQVSLPNPAGLEPKPDPDLMLSRDDEKMMNSVPSTTAPPRKRYCGMSARVFGLLLALLLLVIVAIGVGAGVGASKRDSSSQNKSSQSTPSQGAAVTVTVSPHSNSPTTATPSTISGSSTQTIVTSTSSSSDTSDGGCKNGTTYTSTNNTPFEEYCDMDFKVGSDYNTTALDWYQVYNMGSFHGCLDACANDRAQGITTLVAGQCLSASWVQDGGSCWMKNATAVSNSTRMATRRKHAVPTPHVGIYSANIEGVD